MSYSSRIGPHLPITSMNTPRTGLKSVGAYRQGGLAARSDMHTPIALVRSNRIPHPDRPVFIRRLTPYYSGLGKFQPGKMPSFMAEGTDPLARHRFTVDYVGKSVEVRDFIVKGVTLYRIIDVFPIEVRGTPRQLVLTTNEVGPLDTSEGSLMELTDTSEGENTVENPDTHADVTNPFFALLPRSD